MNCIGCGFVIQTEFAFCPKCGARQPARCAGCVFACPAEFAFCPKCGLKQGATSEPVDAPSGPPRPSPPASPESFRVAWILRRYENGSLSSTERWTAILSVVLQTPHDADKLRKNPLGVFVNSINWSKELGQ